MAMVVEPPLKEKTVFLAESVRRFTIDEYHLMIKAGILHEDDDVELLEGYLVEKMPKNPRHSAILRLVQAVLSRNIPDDYHISVQDPMTTESSEPEPDLMILRGEPLDYFDVHPGPTDAALVIEVSDSSLQRDRTTKKRIFARAGVAVYWIINLQENQIEEYKNPSINAELSDYQQRYTYSANDTIPLVLDEQEIVRLHADDLLP